MIKANLKVVAHTPRGVFSGLVNNGGPGTKERMEELRNALVDNINNVQSINLRSENNVIHVVLNQDILKESVLSISVVPYLEEE